MKKLKLLSLVGRFSMKCHFERNGVRVHSKTQIGPFLPVCPWPFQPHHSGAAYPIGFSKEIHLNLSPNMALTNLVLSFPGPILSHPLPVRCFQGPLRIEGVRVRSDGGFGVEDIVADDLSVKWKIFVGSRGMETNLVSSCVGCPRTFFTHT